MALRLGMHAKLYYKVGGVAGPGPWVEMGNVRDLTLNLETGDADVTTRAANGWRLKVATLKDASIEFEMLWDTADAGFAAIQDAFFGNEVIGLAAMDGDITATGSQGLQADCSIMSFTRNEALEESIKVSVTARPTYSATAPEWVTI